MKRHYNFGITKRFFSLYFSLIDLKPASFINKYIFFDFENYNFHVFKSLFIFKVMLAFDREILVKKFYYIDWNKRSKQPKSVY